MKGRAPTNVKRDWSRQTAPLTVHIASRPQTLTLNFRFPFQSLIGSSATHQCMGLLAYSWLVSMEVLELCNAQLTLLLIGQC